MQHPRTASGTTNPHGVRVFVVVCAALNERKTGPNSGSRSGRSGRPRSPATGVAVNVRSTEYRDGGFVASNWRARSCRGGVLHFRRAVDASTEHGRNSDNRAVNRFLRPDG
jgi:hypothetical protein